MNILVMVTGGLSEVLQATPLLRTLNEGLPGARITLAAPTAARGLSGGLPGTAEIVPLDALSEGVTALRVRAAWPPLRRRRFDAAVLCSTWPRARLLAYAAGIPRRVGPAGGATEILLSEHLSPREGDNDAATWLGLAGFLGVQRRVHDPQFVPEPVARTAGEARLLGSGFEDGRILVAIAPGEGLPGSARTPVARWEQDRYAHLANQLGLRHGAAVVLLGTPADRAAVERVLLDLDASVLDLCGELGIDEMAAVVARCDLLVGGDSPLLHLAAAVGTPAVGLFAATDGRRRGPYGPQHRVIQGLNGMHDNGIAGLSGIRVEDVLAGIEMTPVATRP
ncbi:MAG: glycosyltransferase family 9 protein [Candidatus Dormibacteria bacterium]